MLDVIPIVVYQMKGLCTSLLLLTEILFKSYAHFSRTLKFRKIGLQHAELPLLVS